MNVPHLRFDGFDGEWEKKKVKEIAPLQRGFDLVKDAIIPGEYPIGYSNGILGFHNEFKAKGPGVFTGRSGTIGNIHFTESDYWPHNTSLWVTDFKGNNEKFIYYFYKKLDLKKYNAGSTVPTLNRNDVHDLVRFVPKQKEQDKIASFLTLLDKKIEKQQEKIEKLEQFKKGMMQKIFSQELRFKDEDGKEFEEWKKFRLGDIAIIKGRLGWKGLKQEEYVENGAYLVAGKHIKKGIIQWGKCDQITDFRYRESIEIALEENDIIFSKDGSLGNPALIKKLPKEATINSTMMLVRMTDSILPDYLYQVMLGREFKQLIHLKVSGSSIPHLFQADMKEFEFLAPMSVIEQRKISCILNNLDTKLRKENEKLLALEEQKKGFMQGMFV
ncbi:restriction endonuclease subunit S [uncultured Planococcus sp.]|uniref:restriction endonuclease subunit S n=1 Tax=uncultured Planococcus sp. TaxID=337815 RepID=UPI0026376012|nr:restriction endonuclease subunit S [uncultured Planococcus sp.]